MTKTSALQLENAALRQRVAELETRLEHAASGSSAFGEGLEATSNFYPLFESMAQGVVYQDANGAIIRANPAAERILGLSLDEMLGRKSVDPRWRAVQEDGTDFPKDQYPAMLALRTGKVVNEVVMGVFQPQTEAYRWLLVDAVPQFRAGEAQPYQVYTTFTDFTARKGLEMTLRKSEAQYRGLFEHMSEGYAYCQMLYENGVAQDWIYISVNAAFERLTGLQGVSGKRVSEVLPGIRASDPGLFEIYSRVAVSGQPEKFETFLEALQMWFSVSVYSPKPEYFVAVFESITARRQVEATLQAERRNLDALIENTDGSIWSVDTEYRLLVGNALYHQNVSAALGRRLLTGEGVLLPTFPQAARDEWQGYYDRALKGEIFSVEAQTRFAQRVHFVEYRFTPIRTSAGEIAGVTIFGRDITARKQAEDALREREQKIQKLLEILPVGVSILDADRRVVFANPALGKILATGAESLLKGAYRSRRYIQPNGSPMRPEMFASAQAMQSGQAVYDVETGVAKENGEVVWVSVSAVPVDFPDWKTVITTADVTERKRIEAELGEARELFQKIFEKSPVATTLSRLSDRVIVDANEATGKLFGYAPAELIGKASTEFDYWVDPAERRRGYDTLLKESHPQGFEFTFKTKAGTFGQAILFAEVIEQQGEKYFISTVIDITARKQAEEALRESEARYRLIASHTADVIWVLDPQAGKFTYVSPSVERLRGYTPAEVLAQPVTAALTPESLKLVSESMTANLPVLMAQGSGTLSFTSEVDQPHKNGSIVNTEVTTTYLFNDRGEVEIVGVSRDITARKQAEEDLRKQTERLNLATSAAKLGIWDWDVSKNVIDWDNQMYALYGLEPGEFNGAYAAWLNGIHPDDRESSNEISAQAVRGEREYDTEFRVKWPDGAVHWLKANGQVFHDETGVPLRMIGVNYDITQRKQAEEGLRQRTEELEQLLDLLPEAIWISDDPDCKVIRGNRFANQLLGVTENDNISQSAAAPAVKLRQFSHGRELSVDELPMQMAARTGQPQLDFELRIERSGQITRTLLGGAVPLFDAQGKPRGVVANFHDITERKQAEEDMVKMAKFPAENPNPIMRVDLNGSILYANPASAPLLRMLEREVGQSVPASWQEIIKLTQQTAHFHEVEIDVGGRLFACNFAPIMEFGYVNIYGKDITETRQAEEKVQASLQRFDTLFNNLPLQGILYRLIRDQHGEIIDWEVSAVNPLGAASLSTSASELLGKYASELYGNEVLGPYLELSRQVAATGAAQLFETHFESNGRDYLSSVFLVGQDYYANVSVDITDRKRAEAALKASEERFRTLIESAPVAVSLGREGTLIYANPMYLQMHGLDRAEEVVGHSVVERLAPQSRELSDERSRRRAQGLPTEPQYEVFGLRKDGTEFPLLASVTKLNLADGPANIGFFQDISSLKRAEDELRASKKLLQAVIDNTSSLIYVTDLAGRFLLVNHKLETLFGSSGAQIIGQTRAAFLPEAVAAQHRSNDLEVVQTGQGKIFEEESPEPDGRHVYLTTKFPLLDENQAIYAVCGISTDMTDRKQMEEELRRSNAELEQFAYVASHDLQEPLRAVAGMVQLLGQRYKGQLDERADEYIYHAVEAAGRMQALINDLLDYSRVERLGRPFEPVEVQKALAAALDNLQVALAESGAQVTHEGLPTVLADGRQMIQVLQNLIGNALKFRGEKPPQIHLRAEKVGNDWRFAVSDNGIGIDPRYFERIFLVFQRLHTRREYPGTGIGLSLCKKIIERHGGKIWVESKQEEGSTFYFTIPERKL